MDCGDLPPQSAWGEEGDPSQSLFTPESAGGGLAETPLLWDGLRGQNHTDSACDRPGVIWASPPVRRKDKEMNTQVRSCKLLPQLSLMDPFEPAELNLFTNKTDSVRKEEQPPVLFPTHLTELPLAEPTRIHIQ